MEKFSFEQIKNKIDLEDILKRRGNKHDHYSFYMSSKYYSKESIENIRLTNGKKNGMMLWIVKIFIPIIRLGLLNVSLTQKVKILLCGCYTVALMIRED